MSGSLNKVMLIGNLGKDPETLHFDGGGMLVKFPVATSENYTNRNGDRVSHTEWHNIVVSRKGLADVCDRYLKKGFKVYLEGRIKTRKWTDEAGQNRYATEIVADSMTMLTNREDAQQMQERQNSQGYTPPASSQQNTAPQPKMEDQSYNMEQSADDDDLPF